MKVVHLSTSDLPGGAAIACKRIVDAQAVGGIDPSLIVQKKISSDPKVYSTTTNPLSKLNYNMRMIPSIAARKKRVVSGSRKGITLPMIGDNAFTRICRNRSRGQSKSPLKTKGIPS